MIAHEVSGTGKVESSQEMAVFVLENIQVEQVMVHPGQAVKKGEHLNDTVRGKYSGSSEKNWMIK